MATESLSGTPLTLEQIKENFPPQKENFTRTVKDGVDIFEANVSRNSEGVIFYVKPGSAHYVQRASKPETSGV